MNITQGNLKENYRKKGHSIFGKKTNKIFTYVKKEMINQKSDKKVLNQVHNNISFCPPKLQLQNAQSEQLQKISKYPYLENNSNIFYKTRKESQGSAVLPKFESIAINTSNTFDLEKQFIPNSYEVHRVKTEGSNNGAFQVYQRKNNLASFDIFGSTDNSSMKNGFVKVKYIQNLEQFKKSQEKSSQHKRQQSEKTIFRQLQEEESQECDSNVFHSFMDPKHKELPFQAKVRKLEDRIKDLNKMFDEA